MAQVEYQARFLTSAYIERGRNSELVLGVYAAGALVAPSSGAITVYDATDTAVVSAAAVTITGSQATYVVTAATTSALSLAAGWRVEWSLLMPDAYTHVYRQDAALCRIRLAPVVTDADLLARHTDLTSLRPSSLASYEGYIAEAWRDLVGRLEGMGRRPYLIISPEALRPIHLATTLAIIFRDFAGTGDPANKWAALAQQYADAAESAWSRLTLVYDETDSGRADATRRRGPTTMWLAGRA